MLQPGTIRHPPPRRNDASFGLAVALILITVPPAWSQAVDPDTGEARRPNTIHELTDAFRYTFKNLLEKEQYALYRTLGPEEIRDIDPDLYEQISQNVVRWTDEWVAAIDETLDTVSLGRLQQAVEDSKRVDELLRGYFAERDWAYKELHVVLLPARVFHNAKNRGANTGGVYIHFYPKAFFASISRDWPLAYVLVHESIHSNQRSVNFGYLLTEGITDTAARHIAREYGLKVPSALRGRSTYPVERARIDQIISVMGERAGLDRVAAIETLLEFYFTGESERMDEVLGEASWSRIVELSRSSRLPSKKEIRQALALGIGD